MIESEPNLTSVNPSQCSTLRLETFLDLSFNVATGFCVQLHLLLIMSNQAASNITKKYLSETSAFFCKEKLYLSKY